MGQVSPAATSFLWPDIITYNLLWCVHLVAATHTVQAGVLLSYHGGPTGVLEAQNQAVAFVCMESLHTETGRKKQE